MRLLAPAFKFHFKEGRRTMILSVLSSPALVSGLDFSAMIFPVVHIGAIAVSFLFVVMMFNIQIAEIHEEVLRYLPVSVAMIGAIVLTMHRTTKVKRQDVFRRNALDSRRTIMRRIG
ncbi:NADH-ubiquinone oxidoreductase chain 6 [Gossypium australe]|uniref:NADH-ubiquinone oxidoreductase chain 6 n=1 Tax=Gossypium australe TaxID=47621 RepID=A0A5B6TW86_9ROSI|nr:NADH-ubiquinone oxidoreductase chain 6 [Gossypium australe]